MRAFFAIFQRQLSAYFFSMQAYVMMALFVCVCGLNFCGLVMRGGQGNLRVGDILFGSVYFWILVMAAIALITMQIFTEEKRLGTLEALLTAPVTDLQVTIAKFLAALFFFILLCLPTLLYLPLLRYFSLDTAEFDWLPVLTGYGMLFLIGAFYTALGLFASALARSPAAAAMLTFTVGALLFFEDAFHFLGRGAAGSGICNYMAGAGHVQDFAQGIFDSRPLVFYCTGIAFLLFTTVKIIEKRHWK